MLMLSELVHQGQMMLDEHGDLPVVLYDNDADESYGQTLDMEFNDDVPGEPVVLIGFEPSEEKND